ncbi:hypothetical protein H5J24_14080 [Chryseobacterium capnotolerans]|uniref:hypothetical protein n=1 Tax=Chryseobacterium TaxID=59732 RepID=UPI000A510D83|nr:MULTISPECIES: hypothetical protein [Chryseobacterium]UHO36917.1 hypothetical protein H5J24_14080 [Chryseobacterium capnotolerans]
MKKLVLLSSFLFMITSCHNEGAEDVSLEKNSNITTSKIAKKTTSNNTIITLSMDPVTPICYNSILDNRNVQLHISQPAPYDIQFKLTLQQKALGGYLSVPNPWVIVIIPKGETWATLDTACQLESFISCGKYTEIKTANFRLTVTSAKYFSAPGETFNYEFNNGVNTYDFAHQVSCLGGGWNPDEPK